MKEGTIRSMRRPRKPEHDIQNIAEDEQSGGCGYIGRRDGFIPETLLHATQFRTLISAKTGGRMVLCDGTVIRSKQNTIFSSTVSDQTCFSDLKAVTSIALTHYVFVHEPHPKPG